MATVRRPGSPFWYVRFKRRGREVYVSARTRDRGEAERLEAEARLAFPGSGPGTGRLTLDQAAGLYWRSVERKPDAKNIERHLEAWLALLGGRAPLAELTNPALAEAVAKLRSRRSDATVNRYLVHLRAAINHAIEAHDAAAPRLNWRRHMLREPAPRLRWLTPAELDRLLAAAAPHLKPLVLLAVYTGLRRGELASLDWRQVDLDAGVLRVTLKGGGRHLVHLGGAARATLAALGPRRSGAVFAWRGRPLKSWSTAWRRAKARAGVEDLRWHDLRHTFATWARRAGADLELIRAALGHADIRTTARYAHHSAPELAALADKVAAQAGGQKAGTRRTGRAAKH